MTKAIIGIANFEETANELRAVAARIDAGERLPSADYQLNFATASQLYRLAKLLGRNYSNVHAAVASLMELGLIARNEADQVFVPWEDIEIHISLSGSKAA